MKAAKSSGPNFVGRQARGLWWKIWIASQPRSIPRSTAFCSPPAVETCAPISMEESLRVRFAPSPTGALHIGGARTALYNWLAARGTGGTLVLRIEDTDRERSTPENVEQILDALRWLELDWDEGPISQVERARRHRERLEELIGSGAAYRDTATGADVQEFRKAQSGRRLPRRARERGGGGWGGDPAAGPRRGRDGRRRRDPRRDQLPERLQDDPVIARADGSVLYNFAVAVDDADMGITDVIRGDDHLSNTPKQLLVLAALGEPAPRYAHLPLLHGPDGKKLSKRHGAASVQELREAGYLPAAVRNYLALLGWGTEDDETILRNPRAGRALLDRPGRPGRGDLRREEAALAQRPLHARAAARRLRGGAGRAPRAHRSGGRRAFAAASPEARAEACEIVRDKAQTVTEIWPLIAFLFADPATGRRREGVAKGDEAGHRAAAERGCRGRSPRPTPSTPRRSSGSSAS